jgi:hypothetical protein
MNKAKWVVVFLLAVAVAVPAYAVELTLGGFPSYMRTRARIIHNGTFISTLNDSQAEALGFANANDNVIFVDTRLRLTPQLVLSNAVTIRAQVDVMDNTIWGGTTSALLGGHSTLVNSSLTPGDRFRGALLIGQDAVDDVQFFNVRMLHLDLVLPYNLGFMRIGRQPFDWGLGILANGGWDPLSDLGFIVDRFLWLKSWAIGKGAFTFIFVSDRFTQGNSLVVSNGDGYDIGAIALVYNYGGLTIGGYVFPYIHQENFGVTTPAPPLGVGTGAAPGLVGDLQRVTLWSGLIDYKSDWFRLVGEIQGEEGTIEDASFAGVPISDVDINHNIIAAGRVEIYPKFPVKIIAGEFGYAQGGSKNSLDISGGNEGGLVFNPAYNIDNLLFKHMIPTIYQIEGSVINAFYARAWGTVKLMDHVTFTPQALFAWNTETTAPLVPGQNVDQFLGAEFEGTLGVEVVQGVNFDFIGSVVIEGSGLQDLLEQQAAANVGGGAVPNNFDAPSSAFTFQGRLLVYIDQFFKK